MAKNGGSWIGVFQATLPTFGTMNATASRRQAPRATRPAGAAPRLSSIATISAAGSTTNSAKRTGIA